MHCVCVYCYYVPKKKKSQNSSSSFSVLRLGGKKSSQHFDDVVLKFPPEPHDTRFFEWEAASERAGQSAGQKGQ